MIACTTGVSFSLFSSLQNSLYFSVNSSTRGSQTKGLERGWKQRARLGRDVFFLSPHTGVWGSRVRLLRRALPISLLILRKKTDCFAVYFCQANEGIPSGKRARSIDDGDSSENATWIRVFFKLSRVYCDSLKMSNVGEIPWTKFLRDGTHVWKEKEIFVVACLRSP